MQYAKLPGAVSLHGPQYEYKMAALMYLRGVNHTAGFFMGTNVAGAGAFDDVVFKYKLKGEQEYRTCFMQLKHNEKGNSIITLDQLRQSSGNFSMYKYYKSYCEVAMTVGTRTPELFDVNFGNCDFFIYTNGKIDKSLTLQKHLTRSKTSIFATNKVSPHFNPSYLNDSTVKMLKEECDKQMTNDKALKDDLKDAVKNQWVKDLKEVMKNNPIEDFLRQLQWFTEQASEAILTSLIEEEVEKALKTDLENTRTTAQTFIEKMKLWWSNPLTSDILTGTAQLWVDIVDSRLDFMNDSKKKEMTALNISFTDGEIDSFNQSLTASLVISVTSPHVQLTGLKISQVLEKHHFKRFIFMDQAALLSWKPEVLRAWQSAWCDILVIECSTGAEALAAELSKESRGKKLILLSESELPGYQQVRNSFIWSQLEATSQQWLLDKKVDFQGYDVSLGLVVGVHGTHALTGDRVLQLLTPGVKLTFGKKLVEKIPYFIPRCLERFDYVTKDIFERKYEDDYFIISDMTENGVIALEKTYSVKLKEFKENQTEVPHHFYWTDHSFTFDNITRMRQKIPDKNVHWLAKEKNNCLYWKQTFNKMDVIKNNLERSKKRTAGLVNVNERVILVAAEPGMGKTTYLNEIARASKEKDNTQWAVVINLNEITKKLKDQTEKYFTNHENVTDFLLDMLQDGEFGKDVLRSRLTNAGNVNVYFDGYDEISPYYNDKVTNMIKSMEKLKVGHIWLTSRNVMRHHLEGELDSICYSLKPFTSEDQISFLVQYWSTKHSVQISDKSTEFAQKLLEKANESFSNRDRTFMGIPLQCMMLGEVFAVEVRKKKTNLPKRLDLLHLFEQFILHKTKILNEGKDEINTANPRQICKEEKEHKQMMENHSDAAMLLLLSDEEFELLTAVDKNKLLERFTDTFSVGKEWTGLIDGMTDAKPSFSHRSFAEYFLAWWLSENILSNAAFIKQRLFKPRFETVRQFFDRLLARDSPLHNAVLSADRKVIEELLTSGTDVNQVDKGGRTSLHLAASLPVFGPRIMQLLMDHGANVSLTDTVLKWTPLRYADTLKSWKNIERLLKSGANTKDLEETRTLINSLKEIDRLDVNQRITCLSAINSILKMGGLHIIKFAVNECQLEANTNLYPANNFSFSFNCIAMSQKSKSSLLHITAQSGSISIFKYLVKIGGDIYQRDYKEMTALHHAAWSGRLRIVQYLVESGVHVDVKDKYQRTPLHLAIVGGHVDTVKWLLSEKADPNAMCTSGMTPLRYGIQSGDLGIVRCLLDSGAEQRVIKDDAGMNVLHCATNAGHVNIETKIGYNLCKIGYHLIKRLLGSMSARHGYAFQERSVISDPDENRKCNDGMTPMHYAAQAGHIDLVKGWIELGSNFNIKCIFGMTPMHYAAQTGQVAVVKCLIEVGADMNSICNDRRTPLHYAAQIGQQEVIECLLESNADATIEDTSGRIALHYAVISGHLQSVILLSEAATDINAVDENGISALKYASRGGHKDIVEYLSESGAELAEDERETAVPEYQTMELCVHKLHAALHHSRVLENIFEAFDEGKIAEVRNLLSYVTTVGTVLKPYHTAGLLPPLLAKIASYIEPACTAIQTNMSTDKSFVQLIEGILLDTPMFGSKNTVVSPDTKLTNIDAATNSTPKPAIEHNKIFLTPLMLEYFAQDLRHVIMRLESTALRKIKSFLHEAASSGDCETVEWCLKIADFDVNFKGVDDITALHISARAGSLDVVERLLAAGADVKAVTVSGQTALHWAVEAGNMEVAQRLVRAGADLNVRDSSGGTPMSLTLDPELD